MLTNRKVTALIFSLLFVNFAFAQTKVKKETSRIKGENISGYALILDGTATEVKMSFLKFLKTKGKVKQSEGNYILTESSISKSANAVYAVAKEQGGKGAVWMGIIAGEWGDEPTGKIESAIEKMVYEFGVQFKRDQIQGQIDESTRALQAVDKQKQRLVNDDKNLHLKVEGNKREKIRLEKNLEDNKKEYQELLKKIAKNKHDQDSVSTAGIQIKKVVDAQKLKQSQVK